LIGHKPENVRIIYSKANFLASSNIKYCLNTSGECIFSPESLTITFTKKSALNQFNLFYLYFGKGFYCEKSKNKNQILQLLIETSSVTISELKSFSKSININEILSDISDNIEEKKLYIQLIRFELFAIWQLYYLLNQLSLFNKFKESFLTKIEGLNNLFSDLTYFEKKYGSIATMIHFGMPHITTYWMIMELLHQVFNDMFKNIQMVIHYGSKKEYSDIDLLIIGQNLHPVHTQYLDINTFSFTQFIELAKLYDITVTDPIFTGKVIYGDRIFLERLKQNLLNYQISESAIEYNFRKGRESYHDYLLIRQFERLNRYKSKYASLYVYYYCNAWALSDGKKFNYKK